MKQKSGNPLRMRGADFSYRYFHQCFIVVLLFVVLLIMSITNESFRTFYNYGNLLNSSFPLMMAAFGEFLIILTAGIDISVGSMITLSNCLSAYIMTNNQTAGGAVLAVFATLGVGLLCGAFNGLFIAKFRLPAIIVTIASGSIFKGIALVIMPNPGGTVHSSFSKFFTQKFFDRKVPMSFFMILFFIVVLVILTNRTSFGKGLRAIGGSESSAYGSGINVEKTKWIAYALCGLLCSVGGMYLTARTSCGDANIGNMYTVYAITATVVGGTLMTGAVGEAYGTACGAVIIYLINNILNMLEISTYYQYAVQGMVLIFALMIGSFETRHRGA